MKILLINKFLHLNGGSETYIQTLGRCLEEHGHEVQYFGMEHPERILGNRVGAYTAQMDFHGRAKLAYAVKTIYSREARGKLRLVLEDFQPDVCHLNNFHYQLTPSILPEIRRWQRQRGKRCGIVMTAHDYQLVCPNHMCHDIGSGEPCEKCLGGSFLGCIRGRCIHGSLAKSVIAALEAVFWNSLGIYRRIDTVICCSRFLKEKLDTNPILAERTVVMHNFIPDISQKTSEKRDYVLYFGRYSQEKGIDLMLEAAAALPQIPFVLAGSGPMEACLSSLPNIRNVGFQTGEALEKWIREARFTVYPSRWQENCPLSVMESIAMGTPVLAADSGGIPELVQEGITGELFERGNAVQLRQKLLSLWSDPEKLAKYTQNCRNTGFPTEKQYYDQLLLYYTGEGKK